MWISSLWVCTFALPVLLKKAIWSPPADKATSACVSISVFGEAKHKMYTVDCVSILPCYWVATQMEPWGNLKCHYRGPVKLIPSFLLSLCDTIRLTFCVTVHKEFYLSHTGPLCSPLFHFTAFYWSHLKWPLSSDWTTSGKTAKGQHPMIMSNFLLLPVLC